MAELLQQFETPVAGRDAETYIAYLNGRQRADRMWEAWIVFERVRDGRQFASPVETTQANADGVLYWAAGLSNSYFEGALQRAQEGSRRIQATAAPIPPPLVQAGIDRVERNTLLSELESSILAVFARYGQPRLLTQDLFDALPNAHADVVRAIEDMEKQRRLLVRKTEGGNDWLFLTEGGLRMAGMHDVPHTHDRANPEPSKSAR
jgi:hypothetical protein